MPEIKIRKNDIGKWEVFDSPQRNIVKISTSKKAAVEWFQKDYTCFLQQVRAAKKLTQECGHLV